MQLACVAGFFLRFQPGIVDSWHIKQGHRKQEKVTDLDIWRSQLTRDSSLRTLYEAKHAVFFFNEKLTGFAWKYTARHVQSHTFLG